MRRLVRVLLWLCVHLGFAATGSSSQNVQPHQHTAKNHTAVMGTKMTISPTWYVSVGDTVTINCTVTGDPKNKGDEMDLRLIWTKIGPGEKTRKVLVSKRASAGLSYVLGPVTHEHQGIYTCEDDGSMLDVFVLHWHHIIWLPEASPRASIDVVSHNRTHFFNNETFTLSCQLPDDGTQWTMMRFDEWEGYVQECPGQELSGRRLSCTTRSQLPWSDVLYWCETPEGERSNALNISATVVSVIMEAPSLPVLEGENVTLRCLHRDRNTKKISSDFRTIFFKNSDTPFITYSPFTLQAVTKADEGLYKCYHTDHGYSPESWIAVKARPAGDQETS